MGKKEKKSGTEKQVSKEEKEREKQVRKEEKEIEKLVGKVRKERAKQVSKEEKERAKQVSKEEKEKQVSKEKKVKEDSKEKKVKEDSKEKKVKEDSKEKKVKEDSQKKKVKEDRQVKKGKQVSQDQIGRSGKPWNEDGYSFDEVLPTLDTLTEAELSFFENVRNGYYDKVARTLASEDFKSTMNINTFNIMGHTVLHIAVRNQDERMVKLLLRQEGIKIYDTVLHAVYEKNEEITKLLLVVADQEEAMRKKDKKDEDETTSNLHTFINPSSSKAGYISSRFRITTSLRPVVTQEEWRKRPNSEVVKETKSKSNSSERLKDQGEEEEEKEEKGFLLDSEFHPVITPLMLAAQQGSTPLMALFYERKEQLESELFHHNVKCPCDICEKLEGKADMDRAYQRLHLFKAITNPEYICFIAKAKKMDPVQYAIDKILKIREMLKRDQCFDRFYVGMPDELEKFICDYLSQCEDTEETELLMSKTKSAPEHNKSRDNNHRYPRLYDSVGLELKKFVAHPYSQNLVSKMWTAEEWSGWESYNNLSSFGFLMIRFVCLLVLAPAHYIGSTCLNKKRAWGAPASRFLNHIAAYLWFLLFLTAHIFVRYYYCNHQQETNETNETRECDRRGPPNNYVVDYVFLVPIVFGTLISIWYRMKIGWFLHKKWNLVEITCQLLMVATFICWIYSYFWVQNNPELEYALERKMWPHYSAEVVGECLLAVGTMLAFARFLRFTQLLPVIGPLQVGVGKQITGTFSFFGVYLIFMFAFGSGLIGIYSPYKGFHGYNDKNEPKAQDNTFANPVQLFHHLFYAVRGSDNVKPATLLKWEINLTDGSGEGADAVTHDLSQWTGTALLTVLHIIVSLMLGNILGGYLGATRNEVTKDSDTTWKFSKTELYLTFMEDTLLPPPFNLAEFIFNCCCPCCCKGKRKMMDEGKGNRMLHLEFKELEDNYRGLTIKLSQRYRKFRSDAESKKPASRDDVLEIGEELAELKSELKKKRKGPMEIQNKDSIPFVELPHRGSGEGKIVPDFPEFGPPHSYSPPGIPILTSEEAEECELPPASPQAPVSPSRTLKSPSQVKATSPQSPSTLQKGQGHLPPKSPTQTPPKAQQVLVTPSGRVIPKYVSSPDGGAQASPSSKKGAPPLPSHPSTIYSSPPPPPPPLTPPDPKRKSWDKAQQLLKTKSGRERGSYESSSPPPENRDDTRVAPIVKPRPLLLSELSETDDETSPPQSTSPGSPSGERQVFGTPSPKKEAHK